MAVEYHVVRKVWVAQCNCNTNDPYKKVYTESAPRETRCPRCGTWLACIEETASSPEYKGNRTLLNE